MKLSVALKAFWGVITDSSFGNQVVKIMQDSPQTPHRPVEKSDESEPTQHTESRVSDRSPAIELLAALQRDARFVDFIKEDLTAYGDAEIGAVARNVHDACAATLERLFEIRHVSEVAEGDKIALPAETVRNEARYRVSQVVRDEKVVGTVVHAGWIAKKESVPQWRGAPEDALVLAPVEIDV